MKRKPVKDRCCMNPDCALHGQFGKGNIDPQNRMNYVNNTFSEKHPTVA